MPQNGILGWRVGWPRWMDWSKAHRHTAVNKEMLDQSIADAIAGGGVGGGLPGGNLRYVNVRGDAMTGALVLPADPTLDLHAATKAYVDSHNIDAGVFP